MPLYKTLTPNSQTVVKIWKITEPEGDLKLNLTLKQETITRLNGMKSELHRRGFLSIRHILRSFGYTDQDLYYNEHGKPFLKDGKNISITHSHNFSAIAVSENVIGVDIEKQRDKISKIAHKFCDYEFGYLNDEQLKIRNLTLIWCAKESLYKLYAQPGLSFKEHTLIIPCDLRDGFTNAWILYDDDKLKYDIEYLEFEGFTCAYAMPIDV